jgi:ankyrin repeat protein
MAQPLCPNGVYEAILNDDLDWIVEMYPRFDPNCYIAVDNFGISMNPIIQVAIQHGRVGIVEYLIGKGASIEARDSDGHTALHRALNVNNHDIILLLYDKGADLSATDLSGNAPLMYAVIDDDYEIVKLFLDADADPNHVNMYGNTVLHNASRNGYFEIVKLLLDYDADPTILNNQRQLAETIAMTPEIELYIRNYVPLSVIKEPEPENRRDYY